MPAMTPIKQITVVGVKIYTEDYADTKTLQCEAEDEDKARWVGWSLARAHGVNLRIVIDELVRPVDSSPPANLPPEPPRS